MKKDLSDITYNDIYEHVEINEKQGLGDYYKYYYRNRVKSQHKWYRLFALDIENMISHRIELDKNKPTVLVFDRRFDVLSEALRRDFNVVVLSNSGKGDWELIKNRKKVYFYHKEQYFLNKGYKEQNMKYAKKAVALLIDYYEKYNVKCVFLGNDLNFLERAFFVAAGKVGITRVTLQHTLYDKEIVKNIKLGAYSDYIWLWSDYYRDLIKNDYKDPDKKLRVLGFTYPIRVSRKPDNRSVLFIDSPIFISLPHLKSDYINMVNSVVSVCKSKGYKLRLRPHPGTEINYLQEITDNDFIEISTVNSLIDDIDMASVIVGPNSTASLQIALSKRDFIEIDLPLGIRGDESEFQRLRNYVYKSANKYDDIEKAIVMSMNDELPHAEVDPYLIFINENFVEDVNAETHRIINDHD